MRHLQRTIPTWLLTAAATLALAQAAPGQPPVPAGPEGVDFRYAPPWWQTAICLPDDPDKVLVGKEGQVLLDFGRSGVRNFGVVLQPEIEPAAPWRQQQTVSPRAPIVQTVQSDAALHLCSEAFVVIPPESGAALPEAPSGGSPKMHLFNWAAPERRIVLLLTLRNTGAQELHRRPALRISSVPPVRSVQGGGVLVGPGTRIQSSESGAELGLAAGQPAMIRLPEMLLRPGEGRQLAWTIDRNSPAVLPPLTTAQASQARDAAREWWERADLPWNTIQVPDAGIQGMLEACVRNIWQARRSRTVCRHSMWVPRSIADSGWWMDHSCWRPRPSWDAAWTRAGVEYLLSHQKPDGSFEVLPHFWKENGIVLWAASRHARLTQDPAWLRARWPKLRAVVQAIAALRVRASARPDAPEFGLLPPGEVDGGISNAARPEYSNTYWCLAGLKSIIAAAHWLGELDDASAWQHEYDDFLAAYRRAAARDVRLDPAGHRYVPTMMRDIDHHVPQRGQWAFCHAVYPGGVFAPGDPLASDQLAMLRATRKAGEGLVYDTGWMRGGIWTYFASFYGHAVLWNGQADEAAGVLYDFARHACPTRVWREEQKPAGQGNEEVGDMPHNWASAEFVRLCDHLIELDRGDELHLFEGLPRSWAGPGKVTRLSGVLTPFGPLHLELRVTDDGQSVHLRMAQLRPRPPAKIVVHLRGLTGVDRTVDLPTDRDIDQTFRP